MKRKYSASFTYKELCEDGARVWKCGDGEYEVEGHGSDLLELKQIIREDLEVKQHQVLYLMLRNFKRHN